MNDREALLAEIQRLRLHNQTLSRELKVTRAKDQQLIRVMDRLYKRIATPEISMTRTSEHEDFEGITFIVAAYNIPGQLHRTLTSLTPHYQGCSPDKIEVIVIDNGSAEPITREQYGEFPRLSKVIRVDGHPSPVHGLNLGIQEARFSTVGIMIDGAHVLSPGVVRNVSQVVGAMPRPVINVPQYIMGKVSQNLQSPPNAFEIEEEDLRELGWPADGYTLFDYAVVAGESPNKLYFDAIESNCLVTTKPVLESCGAYDERFDEPGAGLANIELFERLVHEPDNQYVVLLGEGSFHQNHGGTTTSQTSEEREKLVKQYYEKYETVTGKPKNFTLRAPFVFGEVSSSKRILPTISTEYGRVRGLVLKQLAEIYVARARQGVDGPTPNLTLKPVAADERTIRPVLKPLGIDAGKDRKVYGYRSMLRRAHEIVEPRRYLEIGVDDGGSMSLSNCPSVGIDPAFEVTNPLKAPVRIFKEESDQFFNNTQRLVNLVTSEVDLAFIDGMHLAEYVVRDFINIEKHCAEGCVVLIDDVYPEQPEMAARDRAFNAWCGDVYKIVPILLKYRPDLSVSVFEAFAGPYRKGLALITGLQPGSTALEDNIEQIYEEIHGETYAITSIDDLDNLLPIASVTEYESLLRAGLAHRGAQNPLVL